MQQLIPDWHPQQWMAMILAFCSLVALVLATGTTNRLSAQSPDERVVSIYDGNTELTFVTNAATVREALDKSKTPIGTNDAVEPALDTKLVSSNYHVNVYRARPVLVVDGEKRETVLSPFKSAKQITEKAGIELHSEDIAKVERVDDVLSDGTAAQKIVIERAIPFTFNLYGKTFVARTQGETVGRMLKEKGVVLAPQDGSSHPMESPIVAGMTVQVWRNGKQTITQEEVIPKPVQQINDTAQKVGYKQVKTPGVDGKRQVSYEIEMRNGIEISRKVLSSVVTVEPVKEVIIVGAMNNYSGTLNEWLHALRVCEAGGVYTRNTGNGFYGAYQFMIGTWDRIAPKAGRPDLVGVRPDLASPADQDMMIIANTKLSSGGLATQNPGCYKKLGLSQFPPQ